MPLREGTITADGVSEVVLASGSYTLHLEGTFGGGTVQIQFQDKSGVWHDYNTTDYSFTAPIVDIRMNEVQPTPVRLNVTGATSPSIFYRFGV